MPDQQVHGVVLLAQCGRQGLNAAIECGLLLGQVGFLGGQDGRTRFQYAAGGGVGIDCLGHARDQTIGAGKQGLDLRAELLVIQGTGELGGVELQRTVGLRRFDTQLGKYGQLVTRTCDHQLLAHGSHQRTGHRIAGQGTSHRVAIGIDAGLGQRVHGLDERIVGIDERLHRGFQAFGVGRHRHRRSTGIEHIKAQAADGRTHGIGFTGHRQAVDAELGIVRFGTDVACTGRRHCRGTVDDQLRDTAQRNIGALASGRRAHDQARAAAIVDDVGAEALGLQLLVDGIPRIEQGRARRDVHIIVGAILADLQRAGGDGAAVACDERGAGHFRRGRHLVDLDHVTAIDRGIVGSGLDDFFIGGRRGKTCKCRGGAAIELIQGSLVGGQGTF
ncbi:hypothetical protein D3C84_464530 [compost metagenome]